MAYLGNRIVNLLNLHYGIFSLAVSGGGVFFAVFLLHAGVAPPYVLLAVALILGLRFLVRPLVLLLAKRIGLKPLLMLGTATFAVQYPLLAEVHGIGWPLLAFCVVGGVGDALYWTNYHAYFAALGDVENRGRQVSAREAIAAMIGIAGPLIGAWLLTSFGPHLAFYATSVTALLSSLPLLGTPNVEVARDRPGAFRAARTGIMLFAADGWIASAYVFIWQIMLFRTLGESYAAFGGAMAAAAMAGALLGLLLGRHIDAGHGTRATSLAFAAFAATLLLRTISGGVPWLAVLANASGALVNCLYIPTLMTSVYNQAKRAPCTFRFHVAAEGGWDVGGASGCIAAALLLMAGLPLQLALLLASAGMILSFVLLRGYYGRAAVAAE